jgi:branched-subunit amino acid transport protein
MNNALWIAVIGTSVIAFSMKFAGHSVPERLLSHPLIKRINLLIPIALLSALVAVQSVTSKSAIVIDHRLAGLAAAILALVLKGSFPIVVLSAAITSACVYNFF